MNWEMQVSENLFGFEFSQPSGGGSVNPLIKWPGGKSREIEKIKDLIPVHKRYVEPFFGGGALFFDLTPKTSAINDISADLMHFYKLVKNQDSELRQLLECYNSSFQQLMDICRKESLEMMHLFFRFKDGSLADDALANTLWDFVCKITAALSLDFWQLLVLDGSEFNRQIHKMVLDKCKRTVANYNKKPFSTEDLCENFVTGFTSGYYMYFRKVFNDFYYIREYCYGSMFRYNAAGEFNIPYGGMSYNKKDFGSKIKNMFQPAMARLLSGTAMHCQDFEDFFAELHLSEDDFLFLDPPYDTDFSDYEGKDFTKYDQERLANALKKIPAKFLLIIKNTEFIWNLYKDFHILTFDKQYTYNVRSRNDREAEHLIITNY